MNKKRLLVVLCLAALFALPIRAQLITLSPESIPPQAFSKAKAFMSESDYTDSIHTLKDGNITLTDFHYATLHRAGKPRLVSCAIISLLPDDSIVIAVQSTAGVTLEQGVLNGKKLILIRAHEKPGINGPTVLLYDGRLIDLGFTVIELRTDNASLFMSGQSIYSRFNRQPDLWVKVPLTDLP